MKIDYFNHLRLFKITLVLSIFGVLISSYLTFLTFQDIKSCSPLDLFDCGLVLSSSYSKILGIPISVFGLLWFIGSLILSLLGIYEYDSRKKLFIWSVISILGIITLIYIEFFLIDSICFLCTLTHIIGIIIFVISILLNKERISFSFF